MLDLASSAVVFFGDGKGAKALDPIWKRLRGAGSGALVVTQARVSVRQQLPGRGGREPTGCPEFPRGNHERDEVDDRR